MRNLLGALTILVLFMPWFAKSVADRSLDVNGLLINFFEVVQEIVTRQPANWENPTPPAQPPAQQPGNGGQL